MSQHTEKKTFNGSDWNKKQYMQLEYDSWHQEQLLYIKENN